jgi:hypothetical protein
VTWVSQLLQAATKPLIWWVIIAPWERGVRIRGGKRVVVLQPGVHLKIPFWDRVCVQSVRLRTLRTTAQTITTRDGKCVTLALAIDFAISDIGRLYDALAFPERSVIEWIEAGIASHARATEFAELTVQAIELCADAVDWSRYGIAQVRCRVTSFAAVRALRLINNEYRTYGSAAQLDGEGESRTA